MYNQNVGISAVNLAHAPRELLDPRQFAPTKRASHSLSVVNGSASWRETPECTPASFTFAMANRWRPSGREKSHHNSLDDKSFLSLCLLSFDSRTRTGHAGPSSSVAREGTRFNIMVINDVLDRSRLPLASRYRDR